MPFHRGPGGHRTATLGPFRDYRRRAREYRWPAPARDGGGSYVARGGQIEFDLEWDRATESIDRLRQKIASHVGFWEHFRDPEGHHVLVVAPSDEREDRIRRAIWRERPRYRSHGCCSFWTTTRWRVREWGPTGAIWLGVDLRAEKLPRPDTSMLRLRTPLTRMSSSRSAFVATEGCIGKPGWWLLRPGGGQVS